MQDGLDEAVDDVGADHLGLVERVALRAVVADDREQRVLGVGLLSGVRMTRPVPGVAGLVDEHANVDVHDLQGGSSPVVGAVASTA